MKVKMKCADLENTHHIQGIEKTAFGGYVLTLENGKKKHYSLNYTLEYVTDAEKDAEKEAEKE